MKANIAELPLNHFRGSLKKTMIYLGVTTLLLDVLSATSLFRLWVEEETVGWHLGIDKK